MPCPYVYMFNKLKQFKDLRDKAKHLQGELGKETVQGSGGWGKVKVDMNGNQTVTKITIDPSVVSDVPKLEEMTKDAVNDAIQKMQKIMATKLKDVGGLDLASELGDMMKK